MSGQETGWPAQRMGMPVGWYVEVAAGSGAEFPVSGDETARLRRDQVIRWVKEHLGFALDPWQENVLGRWINDTPDTPTSQGSLT